MIQKMKIGIGIIITLILINCTNVFANSYTNVEIVDTGLEQLGYLDYYLNKEFNSNLTTTIYDNKNYYDNYCDYKDLREILNQYDWLVFQANENFGMSIGGNTSAIAVIYAGYGNNPYNTDYTQIQNTRIQKFYFTNASFNKALIQADKASAQNSNTTIIQRAYFEIWTYKGEILYTKTYEPPQLKQPYFEFTAKKIGTTTLENVDGNINTYYKSSFDGFVNSYTSNDEIGYLYLPPNYGFGDVFYPKLFIFKNNLSQTQQWLYTGYDFFLQEQTTEYNKFIITVEQSIINAPYYYDILLQSVNEDFEDINIRFVVINENISGPIIETTSGDIISGDEIKNNTTTGDINNTLQQIFQEPNEEELKKEQEENINKIKEELTSNLEENEIMGALETAEKGFIELLQGEPGDFKISWEEVKYMDTKLIPSGEINFSKIARETESIGMVKTTLNIILSGFMALNILKYIYNLLLTTLGIDNPMIIDTSSESTTITETSKIKTASGRTITQTKKYKGGN